MSRRKGEDTPARKRRRLPFKVIIEREEPFLEADRNELEAECRRITNGAEFYHCMSRFGDKYWHVVHFGSEHQADAFKSAVHHCDFARRPAPEYGMPLEEKRAFTEAALLWGVRTGAIRRVLQAYRNTPGSLMQQHWAARHMLTMYRMPDGRGDILHVFLDWVNEHHWHWFNRQRHPGWLPFEEFHWVIPQDAYPHSEE